QVLVDGRSVFRAGIASVVWDDIPIALEDIQRIEVTRGPSSATYGSNSFQGVINIISKHPGDTLGVRLRYRNGNQGEDDSFASYSWQQGRSANRLTVQINAS
ncbi:TonB-dependent receptor plug domain-containing protein, partial [Wenyingzhuangia sp. 1_MG-2023]|nr:TonB-dependent receptor plug domain-containing protein [Wenyingzhuangia sp. 1_MG-2023]